VPFVDPQYDTCVVYHGCDLINENILQFTVVVIYCSGNWNSPPSLANYIMKRK